MFLRLASIVALLLVVAPQAPANATNPRSSRGRGIPPPPAEQPVGLERNVGQADIQVRYIARSAAGALLVTDGGFAVATRGAVIHTSFVGAREAIRVEDGDLLPGMSHYFPTR